MSYVYSLTLISLWLLLVISTSLIYSKKFPKEKELSRKIVHIGTGPVIPLAWWLNIPTYIAGPIAICITIALIINYKFRIIGSIENIERKSFGTIAYGISISTLIAFLWSDYPSAVTAGVLCMSFGDGFAGMIGQRVKSLQWSILGQTKSLGGTLAMAISVGIVLSIINQIIGVELNFLNVIEVTSLAVILEQISPLGIDNITVPLGVALSWQWLLSS